MVGLVGWVIDWCDGGGRLIWEGSGAVWCGRAGLNIHDEIERGDNERVTFGGGEPGGKKCCEG